MCVYSGVCSAMLSVEVSRPCCCLNSAIPAATRDCSVNVQCRSACPHQWVPRTHPASGTSTTDRGCRARMRPEPHRSQRQKAPRFAGRHRASLDAGPDEGALLEGAGVLVVQCPFRMLPPGVLQRDDANDDADANVDADVDAGVLLLLLMSMLVLMMGCCCYWMMISPPSCLLRFLRRVHRQQDDVYGTVAQAAQLAESRMPQRLRKTRSHHPLGTRSGPRSPRTRRPTCPCRLRSPR